jgi:hypothetical protein
MYAGARWKYGCNPEEFMKPDGYCTSSFTMEEIIKTEGICVFEILRIDTNLNGLSAEEYEKRFLAIHKCRTSPEWYNGKISDKPNPLPHIEKIPKNIRKLPSQEYLDECLDYDRVTGIFIWKIRPLHHFKTIGAMKLFNNVYAGKVAGTIRKATQYYFIKINAEPFQAHRIGWKMETGDDPKCYIDHIDGNTLNNAFDNLREASVNDNCCNIKIRKNNSSGYTGVSYNRNCWIANIQYTNVNYNLGYFATAEEAAEAYRKKSLELHGEFSSIHRLEAAKPSQ